MKTFLKETTEFGVVNYHYFNEDNLTSIELCKIGNAIDITTNTYDDKESIEHSIKYTFGRKDATTDQISQQEFKNIYIEYVAENLNKIAKEL